MKAKYLRKCFFFFWVNSISAVALFNFNGHLCSPHSFDLHRQFQTTFISSSRKLLSSQPNYAPWYWNLNHLSHRVHSESRHCISSRPAHAHKFFANNKTFVLSQLIAQTQMLHLYVERKHFFSNAEKLFNEMRPGNLVRWNKMICKAILYLGVSYLKKKKCWLKKRRFWSYNFECHWAVGFGREMHWSIIKFGVFYLVVFLSSALVDLLWEIWSIWRNEIGFQSSFLVEIWCSGIHRFFICFKLFNISFFWEFFLSDEERRC